MDENNLLRLKNEAVFYMGELNRHIVLKKYWNDLSLVMKGSTARGYSDIYSDIDFVIFTHEKTKKQIVDEYIKNELSTRTDGIFLPLGDWIGHYNIETYTKLKEYFENSDIINIWEYKNIIIMHDEKNVYSDIIEKGLKNLSEKYDELVKKKYLDMQLNLDWLRQPLRRADKNAALLYASSFLRFSCHLLYLANRQPYPVDKWMFFYLDDLNIPPNINIKVKNYIESFSDINNIKSGLDLFEYNLYKKGSELIENINEYLKTIYTETKWIDEWPLFA